MTALTYTRYELLRTVRNRRFMVFSLFFPLVMFLLIAGNNRHETLDGISLPVYYMTGMASWGTMAAVVASGARIAAERSINWHRQLRLTPLKVSDYFATKALGGYMMALLTILVLGVAGVSIGVRLDAGQWLEMIGLMLVGLVPFVVIGIIVGQVFTVDSMGPALGGVVSLFAFLGGAWGPLADGGVMRDITELLPSYWLVQSGKVVLGGGAWPLKAWIVIAIWTVALTVIARWLYQRDTARM